MKLIFNSVHISNFLSIGDAIVPLNAGGYTLVDGKNTNPDDTAKSNGAGKSTIFEAIIWALTGTTIRGSKDVVNIYGDDGACVELDFTVDNDSYRIIRTKDHSKLKTNLKVFVNDKDMSGKGIRDTEKVLAELLPDLTGSLLGSVIVLGQGLPQKFTNNTPSGRKEVLEKLSKSDFMIEDLKSRVLSRKQALNTSIRAVEDENLYVHTKIESLETQIKNAETHINSLDNPEVLLEQINATQAEIDTINTAYIVAADKQAEAVTLVQVETAELNKLTREQSAQIQTCIKEFEPRISELFEKYENKIAPLNEKLYKLTADIAQITATIKRHNSVVDTCPTCGQKLPNITVMNTSELEADLENNKLLVEDTKSDIDAIKGEKLAAYAELKELREARENQINKKYDKLIKNLNKRIHTLTADERAISADCISLRNRLDTMKNLNSDLVLRYNSLDALTATLKNTIEDGKVQIEQFTARITELAAEKENLEKHLSIVTKMETVLKRDFRGYLLIGIIDFINKRAKEYCKDVFDTDKIDFILDGNNISITYDRKDYSALSGGEKQKVDIIVQFAIRDMLCKFIGFSSSILVLDEICDNVDTVGADRLFNMISNRLSDVQDIFIISHHAAELQIPYDRQITIVKDTNKISKVINNGTI